MRGHEIEVLANLDPLVELVGRVGAQRHAGIVGSDDGTVLVEPAGAQGPLTLLVTAVRGEMVILDDGIAAEDFFLPVSLDLGVIEVGRMVFRSVTDQAGANPGIQTVVLQRAETADTEFGDGLRKFVGLHQVELAPGALEAHRGVERDTDRPFAGTLLRGDEDHAVGAPGTVDGRCGGIFENLGRGDVARAEEADIVDDNPVDDIDRSRIVDRTDTADADLGGGTGLAGGSIHGHAGGHTLEGLVETGGGRLLELFTLDGGHGAGQVALFHDAIANGYDLFEENGIGLQDDIDDRAADGHFLLGVSHAGDNEDVSILGGNGIVAVIVRGRALSGTLDGNIGSGNRPVVRPGFCYRTLDLLGHRRDGQDQHQQGKQDSFHHSDKWLSFRCVSHDMDAKLVFFFILHTRAYDFSSRFCFLTY